MTAKLFLTRFGYGVAIEGLHSRPLYLGSVKNGKMKLWCDYAYARHYTLKTAQKHVEAINRGLCTY